MDSGRLRKVLIFGLFFGVDRSSRVFPLSAASGGFAGGVRRVWRDLLAMTGVGACFFTAALLRFRKAVTQTQV